MKKLKKCFFPRREEKRREKREREERERESGHCIGARAEEEETYFAKGVEAFSLFSSSTSSSSLLFSSFGSNSSLSLSQGVSLPPVERNSERKIGRYATVPVFVDLGR